MAASQPIRILAIHRYFWPDTPPYAALLRVIAAHWTDAGHEVEVLGSSPSYRSSGPSARAPRMERLDGFAVRRIMVGADAGSRAVRVRRMLTFTVVALLRVLVGPKRDVVMCSTVPPVVLGWAVSLAARLRGAAFVYHCMDLHPEIGALSGEFARPTVFRLLMALERATCRRAAAIVVLSGDMADAVRRRDQRLADRIWIINNFDLPTFTEDLPEPSAIHADDRLRILFAGNLGMFQRLEPMVAAVLDADSRLDSVELTLMGDGRARSRLQDVVAAKPVEGRRRVRFVDQAAPEVARAEMRKADLGLVSLQPCVVNYAYPSKVATYLSEALPVLLAVESDSQLAHEVLDAKAGVALDAHEAEDIRRRLIELADEIAEIRNLRDNARAMWVRDFSRDTRLGDWDRLLNAVANVEVVA